MYATDHPDLGRFVRVGQIEQLPQPEVDAAWERVLVGQSHHEMIKKAMGNPSEALLARLRNPNAATSWGKPVIVPGPAQKKPNADN